MVIDNYFPMYTPLEQGIWTYHLLAVIQVSIWLAFLLQL
jgi:hypothetical protein